MEPKSELSKKEKKELIIKMLVRLLFVPVFISVVCLIPAGTIYYWEVYAYFGVLIVPMIFVLIYFLINDPMFLNRRSRMKEKDRQQKLIQLTYLPVFFAGFIIPGLDHRYGWSDIPAEIVIAADIVVLGSYFFVFMVFRQNSFASRIVEIEKDQKVITTGLYSVVRHPMYTGVSIMYLVTPVALGSYWGLIPMVFIPVIIVFRIRNEEKLLSENLDGYREYCQKTKYRLIPYIW